MSSNRTLNHNLNRLQRIKSWQLVLLLVLFGFLAATFLRLNNIGMTQRREAVIVADESGDKAIIQDRLYDLQRYVSAHMNTDMGQGVALVNTYQKDYQTAIDKAQNSSGAGNNVYKKADTICAPQFGSWSPAYVACISSELAKFPAGQDLAKEVDPPNPSLYIHSFASPSWSPDFAGWAVAICVVIFVMILTRATSVIILKSIIKHRRIDI